MTNEWNGPGAGARPEEAPPEPKRGQAASLEVRDMAVAAVLRHGASAGAAARIFGVNESSVRRWLKQFREHGHLRPGRQGGSESQIERRRDAIFRILAAQPGLSSYELRDALAAEGVRFSSSAVQRFLSRYGLAGRNNRARALLRELAPPALSRRPPHPG